MEPNLRARLRVGDPDAFGSVFDDYAHAVYNLGFRPAVSSPRSSASVPPYTLGGIMVAVAAIVALPVLVHAAPRFPAQGR